MKAGVVSVGCRSGAEGKVEIAERALAKVGLARDEAIQMIQRKACLVDIKPK